MTDDENPQGDVGAVGGLVMLADCDLDSLPLGEHEVMALVSAAAGSMRSMTCISGVRRRYQPSDSS